MGVVSIPPRSTELARGVRKLRERVGALLATPPPFEVKHLGEASDQELLWYFAGDSITELDALHDVFENGATRVTLEQAEQDSPV